MPRRRTHGQSTYCRDVSRYPLLTQDEERRLLAAAQSGDGAARDRLVTCNLRYAYVKAYRFHRRNRWMPLDDAVQAANIGLTIAVDKFDLARTVRFCTYADDWIYVSIRRESYRYAAWVVPAWVREGRPSREKPPVPVVVPFEDVTLPQNARTWSEILPHPDDHLAEADAADQLAVCLAGLTERERHVLGLRYGLADGTGHTLDEVSRTMGVTRERVRQIEHGAVAQMRRVACA